MLTKFRTHLERDFEKTLSNYQLYEEKYTLGKTTFKSMLYRNYMLQKWTFFSAEKWTGR